LEATRQKTGRKPRAIKLIGATVRFEPDELATINAARSSCNATLQSWLHAAALAYSSKTLKGTK